jgi:hypothetical protein
LIVNQKGRSNSSKFRWKQAGVRESSVFRRQVFVSLDNEIAGQIMLLAKTYPHHTSETSDTPGVMAASAFD